MEKSATITLQDNSKTVESFKEDIDILLAAVRDLQGRVNKLEQKLEQNNG